MCDIKHKKHMYILIKYAKTKYVTNCIKARVFKIEIYF